MTNNMKLVGFKILKYEAERNPDFDGKLEIKQNMNIKSIEKHKLKTKEEGIEVRFIFGVDYGNLGKISMEGSILILADTKTTKDIINSWKDKKLTQDAQIMFLNIILQRSSIKALQIEEDLGLPPHFQLPSISPGKQ